VVRFKVVLNLNNDGEFINYWFTDDKNLNKISPIRFILMIWSAIFNDQLTIMSKCVVIREACATKDLNSGGKVSHTDQYSSVYFAIFADSFARIKTHRI